MTKFLVRLFEAPEVAFRQHIDEWEKYSGRQSIDISLTNNIQNNAKEILTYLSLPPGSHEREAYHALNNFLQQENNIVEEILSINETSSPEDVINKILAFVHNKKIAGRSYFAKSSKVKSFLRKHPPKKVMKVLGYRSVDSLLKRELDSLVISLARDKESSEWQKDYIRFCTNLVGSDFTIHDIDISVVPPKTLEKMTKAKIPRSYLVRQCFELGALSIVPPARRFKNDSITCLVAILDGIYQTKLHGSYFNYLSFQKDFGRKFVTVILHGIRSGTVDEFAAMWPAAYRYLLDTKTEDPLIIDDKIDKPADIIVAHFGLKLPWYKFDALAYGQEEPISLHIMDVVTNASNDIEFDKRFIHHVQQEVWDKLSYEYLKNGVKL